jgi:AraC family cel operon transcriptional repressor
MMFMDPLPTYGDGKDHAAPRYARQTFGERAAEPGFKVHRHRYHEVFWVERGRIRHQANGRERLLVPGDLTFIRPDDAHAGLAVEAGGFTLVNVMFPTAALVALRQRFAEGLWPWHDGADPLTVHLDPARIRLLQSLLEAIPAHGAGTLDRDLLALAVVQAARGGDQDLGEAAPPWLREAVQGTTWIDGGVQALADAAGVGLAHLNRTIRRHCGCTASELVSRRRLELAARALRLGQERVIDVALAAGFTNVAHFHRCFRARFGCTPRQYRCRERGQG